MRTERTLGILKLFAAFAILIQITSCSQPRPPVVITLEVTDIEGNQAQSGGQIIDDGGAQIISKGICWGPDMLVDTSNFKTTLGPGAEDFIGIMTNLEYNTTYFVAAYAINEAGISYGETMVFLSAALLPTVVTTGYRDLTSTSVFVYGDVISDGGAEITEKGICWGTSPNPDINANVIPFGPGIGEVGYSITPLQPATDYYVRVFATNRSGTSYGEQLTFRTPLYSFGQAHAGGIIFYLDQTGEHGLVAAPADQSNSAYWGCAGTPVSTSAEVGTGKQNTVNILAACATPGIAARLCDELDLNGYQDWYLPSVDELILMCTNLYKKGIGNFNIDRNYWSSTEYDANLGRDYSFAWDYSSGTVKSGYPEYVRNVRAIRAF
ncbi:MAG: hypothetical protein R6W67_06415 [Bacteroidales bacterium]